MFGNDAIVFKRRAGGGSLQLLRERLIAGDSSGKGEAIAVTLEVDSAWQKTARNRLDKCRTYRRGSCLHTLIEKGTYARVGECSASGRLLLSWYLRARFC
jgi:hypothetical protein